MAGTVAEYLSSLGAPDALLERVESLVAAYESLLTETIESVFVSEYRDDAGDRTFESLWLFTKLFVMEAKLLGEEEDQFDFVPYEHGVRHLVIRKRFFDLDQPSEASRMAVEVWFTDQRYGILKATRDNCVDLLTVLKRHLLPNALPGPVTSPS